MRSLLSHTADSSQQLCNALADAFHPPPGCADAAFARGSPACTAATALARGSVTSFIDRSGGLLQLLPDGSERQLVSWLRAQRAEGAHNAAGACTRRASPAHCSHSRFSHTLPSGHALPLNACLAAPKSLLGVVSDA